ncbi:MAG: hypothetical protein PHO53_03530 [Actinomycetota bacterium]|nr:hypothetical protein [Actinomycetota bacterium]
MRKRYGKADSELESSKSKQLPPEGESEKTPPMGEKETEKNRASWATRITTATRLGLDIIRLIREAVDLKRELFPAKSKTTGEAPSKGPD